MITDSGSLSHSQKSDIFDNVIIAEHKNWVPNVRNYYDTPYANYNAQFNNLNKHKVFELSPLIFKV